MRDRRAHEVRGNGHRAEALALADVAGVGKPRRCARPRRLLARRLAVLAVRLAKNRRGRVGVTAASCRLVGGYVAHPHAHDGESENLRKSMPRRLARDKLYRADYCKRKQKDSGNRQNPTRLRHAE